MSTIKIDKINYTLSGQLQKLSSRILIGYQKKYFSLLENGTKIAYRNIDDKEFSEDKIFFIKDVSVCEAEDEHSFTLQTPKRMFTLKAASQQTKLLWMRTIVALRKLIIRSRQQHKLSSKYTKSIEKKRIGPSTADNTLSISFLNQTQRSIQSANHLRLTERSGMVKSSAIQQSTLQKDLQKKMKDYKELFMNVPQVFVKNNIFLATLKSKVDNLFTASYTQHTYILLSSKSLYPTSSQPLHYENMSNLTLPQWAQANKLYKIIKSTTTTNNNQPTKSTPKLILQIAQIIDIQEIKQQKTAIRIRTQQNLLTLYSQTVEEKERVKAKFLLAIQNYKQVLVNGKLMRRNYDNLLRLYVEKYDQFLRQVKAMIERVIALNKATQQQSQSSLSLKSSSNNNNNKSMIKQQQSLYEQSSNSNSNTHNTLNTQKILNTHNTLKTNSPHHIQSTNTPQSSITIIDHAIQFIEEFTLILSTKKRNNTKPTQQMISFVIKQLHLQIKIVIKLTWVTSYFDMSAVDILKFLNALAAYHLKTKQHITDIQFLAGMKQLSKIYVRGAWKNFEDIILGLVEQQKKANFFKDQDNEYIETNAIVDLFKFLHQVFDMAAPCWQHRLHLHNVQRLMYRAVDTFVNELKGAVDQTVMANSQLIAIANNYFRFSITVDEFYTEKFSTLQQKTKQNWEKVKFSYKQLSNIILDKLAYDARLVIKKFFEKHSFFKLDIGQLCEIIKQSSQNIQVTQFHPVFIKRFYEKLFTAVREGVLSLLQKQVSSKKKKHNITKILQTLQTITFDLMDLARVLYNGKSRIDKQLNQVGILLSCESHSQVLKLIKGTGEDIRKVYMNIINLREDYYMGGVLYQLLNHNNNNNNNNNGGSFDHDHTSVANSSHLYTNTLDPNNRSSSIMRHTRLTISRQRQLRASISSYYINGDFETHSSVDNRSQQGEYDNGELVMRLISEGYLMKCKTNKKVWEREYFRLKNGTLYIYQSEHSEKCQHSIPIVDITRILPGTSTQSLHFTIQYTSLNRQKQLQFKCDNIQVRDRWVESLLLQIKRVKNDQKVKRQRVKMSQKNKSQLIIDYQQLMQGKGYFSYTNSNG